MSAQRSQSPRPGDHLVRQAVGIGRGDDAADGFGVALPGPMTRVIEWPRLSKHVLHLVLQFGCEGAIEYQQILDAGYLPRLSDSFDVASFT